MAGKLEPSEEAAPGQAESSKMTEDLLALVKKLQREGSLEPQIKDLINRINQLQQAKQTSNKELGEGQALQGQLDSLNGEEEHLEEVLRKKQEALKILQEHWHKKQSKAPWRHTAQKYTENLPEQTTQTAETHGEDTTGTTPEPGLDVGEPLEDTVGQHKDLWELQVLKQRLAQEIEALERSQEHLLAERQRLRLRLQEMESSADWDGRDAPAGADRLHGEPESAEGRPVVGAPAPASRSSWSRRWSWP